MKIRITVEFDMESPDVVQVMAEVPQAALESQQNIIPVILARAIEATLSAEMTKIGEGERH